MAKQFRVALYLRVSTQDQSCELQRRELTAFAESRGWNLVEVFEDKATGTNGNRPMLKALMKQARERRFDVLAVWKLDRFARSLKDLVVMLQELSELGVQFVSLKDQLDLSTSAGRLMMQMIGAFAEFEASLIKERTMAGLAHARAQGKQLGRPQIHDPAAIRRLRTEGKSYREISREAGAPMGTITEALRESARKTPSKLTPETPKGSRGAA